MAHRIVPAVVAAIEAHDIHMATCRARRQELLCSTCADLVVLVDRVLSATGSEAL